MRFIIFYLCIIYFYDKLFIAIYEETHVNRYDKPEIGFVLDYYIPHSPIDNVFPIVNPCPHFFFALF